MVFKYLYHRITFSWNDSLGTGHTISEKNDQFFKDNILAAFDNTLLLLSLAILL